MKTLEEKIEIMQAYLDGCEVQILGSDYNWYKTSSPNFNWGESDYRIKPEPRELWINVYNYHDEIDFNNAHKSEKLAKQGATNKYLKTIKFIEVLE